MNKEQKLKFMQLLHEAISEAMIYPEHKFTPYEAAIQRYAEWYAEQIITPCEPQVVYTQTQAIV